MYFFKAESMRHIQDWRKPGHHFRQDNGGNPVSAASDRSVKMWRKCAKLNSVERPGDPRFRRLSWTWPGETYGTYGALTYFCTSII